MTSLFIRTLKLTAFRNYRTADLDLHDGRPVVLIGANGAGKTNMIEAVSCFSPGRGLRGVSGEEVQNTGLATPWAVFADLQTPQGAFKIGTGLDEAGKRQVRIDGKTASQKQMRQLLHVSWLTPQMDRLFHETPSERRQFYDRLVYGFEPDHATFVARYDHARRERLKLLKEGGYEPGWVDTLESRIASYGVEVHQARRRVLTLLRPFCHERIGIFPAADLGLETAPDEEMTAAAIQQKLFQNRAVDAAAGATTWGPHRMDLSVIHAEKKTEANQCSTGEQKALLIALILANARALATIQGTGPILLLDEIAAHLDEARRASLYEEILSLSAQVWMTGTELKPFEALDGRARFVTVEEGIIKEVW